MVDTILVIHHDLEVAQRYARWLAEAGWNVSIVPRRDQWQPSDENPLPSLVIGAARGAQGDFDSLVATIRAHAPRCRLIGLTAKGASAAGTQTEGLDEVLVEPLEEEDLLVAAGRTLGGIRVDLEMESVSNLETWASPSSRSLYEHARRIAEHDRSALLLGESGTGKEHVARWIHHHSQRCHGPFYRIDCAALSREHAEFELFGQDTGALTGSRRRKRGRFELAAWGTILLDEVGELDPALQAKLLAFLDSRNQARVGGERGVSISARIIASTQRDLLVDVERGAFRRDLYYRLAAVPLRIPPLRERLEDVPQLVDELLVGLRRELGLASRPTIEGTALLALRRYFWPGNVRELRNVLERALVHSRDGVVRREHIEVSAAREEFEIVIRFPSQGLNLHELTRDVARRVVAEALRRASSKQEAARLLGISRHALAHQLRVLGLEDSRPSGEFAIGETAADPEENLG
ncbi:MAG: sigma 54-interacting transcriptional regulator [Polyangiaceae bacterium]